MDPTMLFNQQLLEQRDKSGSFSRVPSTGSSHSKMAGTPSVVQPFYDPQWLPQLIGPSPRGTPTFWQQSFGQVRPQDTQGVYGDKEMTAPQSDDYFSAFQPEKSCSYSQTKGPEPTGLSAAATLQPPPSSSQRPRPAKSHSATSEFTKRKNWAHHLIQVLPDFSHVLDFDGHIAYASPSVQDLTGYEPNDLHSQSFMDYIHPEDQLAWQSQFREVTTQQDAPPLFLYLRFRAKDGSYQLMELTGHARHQDTFGRSTTAASLPTDGRCFFGTARPYPSKNVSMVDSFVEHKIENERLKARLARLKAECAEAGIKLASMPEPSKLPDLDTEMANASQQEHDYDESFSISPNVVTSLTISPSVTTLRSPVNGTGASLTGPEPPPSSQYDVPPKSAGPSSTNTSTSGNKKKSRRPNNDDHNYVCHDCGSTDSPEWRRGPLGPKTLCNACGLRWAKKSKASKPGRTSHTLTQPPPSLLQR